MYNNYKEQMRHKLAVEDRDQYLDLCCEIHKLTLALADCRHARKLQSARELEPRTGGIDPIEKIKQVAMAISEAYVSVNSYDTDMVYPCGENSPLERYVQNFGI
jgi:hypothetical protein